MSNYDFAATQNDAGDTWTVILEDESGPVDLSAATVTLYLTDRRTGLLALAADVTKDPDQVTNRGRVSYTFTAADLANAGVFNARWKARWSTSLERSYPNPGFQTLLITATPDPA